MPVRNRFNLRVDGKLISLTEGGIMLGDHQTNLKFVLPEISLQPRSLEAFVPLLASHTITLISLGFIEEEVK